MTKNKAAKKDAKVAAKLATNLAAKLAKAAKKLVPKKTTKKEKKKTGDEKKKSAETPSKAALKIDQLSTSEYADVAGKELASGFAADKIAPRVFLARDYSGIHLFADADTGDLYDPDEVMGKFVNPRVIDPAIVARLGPWKKSTGLVVSYGGEEDDVEKGEEEEGGGGGGGVGGGDDDDEMIIV